MDIKVGPIKYKRVLVPNLRADDDTKLFGQVDYASCEIRIKAGHDPQQQRQSEWHEIMHVILEQVGRGEKSNDESFVTALAHVLMQVVQDNPFLAETP